MGKRCATWRRVRIAAAVLVIVAFEPVGFAAADAPATGESFPPWKQFELQPKDEVEFRLPAGGGQRRWTVNGKPAGDGDHFVLKPSAPGKVTVRGTGTDSNGQTVERVWDVDVRGTDRVSTVTESVPPSSRPLRVQRPAPIAPPIELPIRVPAPRVSRPRRERTREVPDEAPLEATATATVPLPEPATAPPDPVHMLLDRYADAYRHRDVDALRRLGQVTTDGQAQQLRDYFDKTPQLDVEVNILDVSRTDGKTTVRFTRRDRFKDPTGQELSKETPPIEKEVVETPQGLELRAPAE